MRTWVNKEIENKGTYTKNRKVHLIKGYNKNGSIKVYCSNFWAIEKTLDKTKITCSNCIKMVENE